MIDSNNDKPCIKELCFSFRFDSKMLMEVKEWCQEHLNPSEWELIKDVGFNQHTLYLQSEHLKYKAITELYRRIDEY